MDRVLVVDWSDGTCTCGYWQVTGIPCQHVSVCADDRNRDVYDFVSPYFKKEKYLAAYGTPLECTRGREMWDDFQGERPLPPVMKRRPGRPKNNRMKPKDGEIKKTKVRGALVEELTTHGRVVHCSICGQEGHTKRKCPSTRNEANAAANVVTDNMQGHNQVQSEVGSNAMTQANFSSQRSNGKKSGSSSVDVTTSTRRSCANATAITATHNAPKATQPEKTQAKKKTATTSTAKKKKGVSATQNKKGPTPGPSTSAPTSNVGEKRKRQPQPPKEAPKEKKNTKNAKKPWK